VLLDPLLSAGDHGAEGLVGFASGDAEAGVGGADGA
jgi:hypothetical protein